MHYSFFSSDSSSNVLSSRMVTVRIEKRSSCFGLFKTLSLRPLLWWPVCQNVGWKMATCGLLYNESNAITTRFFLGVNSRALVVWCVISRGINYEGSCIKVSTLPLDASTSASGQKTRKRIDFKLNSKTEEEQATAAKPASVPSSSPSSSAGKSGDTNPTATTTTVSNPSTTRSLHPHLLLNFAQILLLFNSQE